MLAQMSRQSALCLVTAIINDANDVFGEPLHARNRKLLNNMFANNDSDSAWQWLALTAKITVPVVGIGAPAQSFYPPVKEFMQADVLVPEHAASSTILSSPLSGPLTSRGTLQHKRRHRPGAVTLR